MRGGSSSLAALGLRRGEVVHFAVRGGCMSAFADGAMLRVRRQRLYVTGDVVVVRRRNYWDAHRFLGYVPSKHGLVALTQADRAEHRDPASVATAIVGRMECNVTASDRATALRRYARAVIGRIVGAQT